jgi:hypothetical protein
MCASIVMAAAHTALKEKGTAYQGLEEAYGQRSHRRPDLQTDPRFDSLRGESRFRNLSRGMAFAS